MLKQNTCQQCHQLFVPRKDSPGIFCSKSCNAKYHNSRRPKKSKPTTECLNCKATITLPNKFCGHSCSATYNNTQRTRNSSVPALVAKSCPQCKTEFIGKTIFCSKRCGWDNKRSTASPEERIAVKRARNRESYRRYIARRKYQTPIGEDIKAIRQFYLDCPCGYEVDHIIPISKGGAHSLDNLQYLTKEENRRKSNKII